MSRCVKSLSIHSISSAHWTAIMLTLIGMVCGFLANFFGNLGTNYIDYKNGAHALNAWWYTPVVMVSILPQSMGILYQEMKLSTTYNKLYPSELIHAWIALMQCCFTLLLSPALIYLSDPEQLFWSDWYLFLHQAFVCLFGTTQDNTMYCPNGPGRTALQFVTWLSTSVCVQLLRSYALVHCSPFVQRFCVWCGMLCAFVCFQVGFPAVLMVNGGDRFDECLLLGVLCSFVGAIMLMIDFNPNRVGTVLDSIQFDEIKDRKHICDDLMSLKEQHRSLALSQQEINININNISTNYEHSGTQVVGSCGGRGKSIRDMCIGMEDDCADLCMEEDEFEEEEHKDAASDYVCYLLMEQQKEMIKEEYESKLKEYRRAQRRRSQTFSAEFYAKQGNKKRRKPKRNTQASQFGSKEQMEEYYRWLRAQQEKEFGAARKGKKRKPKGKWALGRL